MLQGGAGVDWRQSAWLCSQIALRCGAYAIAGDGVANAGGAKDAAAGKGGIVFLFMTARAFLAARD